MGWGCGGGGAGVPLFFFAVIISNLDKLEVVFDSLEKGILRKGHFGGFFLRIV